MGSYVVNGLVTLTNYHFRVRGDDGLDYTQYSNVVSGRTLGAELSLSASTISYNTFGLNWSYGDYPVGVIKIERSLSGTTGFTEIYSTSIGATGFTDSGLTSGVTYYYRIRDLYSSTYSYYSNVISGTTPIPLVIPITSPPIIGVSGITYFEAVSTSNSLVTLDGNGYIQERRPTPVGSNFPDDFYWKPEKTKILYANNYDDYYVTGVYGTSNIIFSGYDYKVFEFFYTSNPSGCSTSFDLGILKNYVIGIVQFSMNHTIYGNISNFGDKIYNILLDDNRYIPKTNYTNNLITGDIATLLLPSGITYGYPSLKIYYNSIYSDTILTYTHKVWPKMQKVVLYMRSGSGLTSTEVDNLLIDLSVKGVNIEIVLVGCSPRTAASNTAYNSIIAGGATISIT